MTTFDVFKQSKCEQIWVCKRARNTETAYAWYSHPKYGWFLAEGTWTDGSLLKSIAVCTPFTAKWHCDTLFFKKSNVYQNNKSNTIALLNKDDYSFPYYETAFQPAIISEISGKPLKMLVNDTANAKSCHLYKTMLVRNNAKKTMRLFAVWADDHNAFAGDFEVRDKAANSHGDPEFYPQFYDFRILRVWDLPGNPRFEQEYENILADYQTAVSEPSVVFAYPSSDWIKKYQVLQKLPIMMEYLPEEWTAESGMERLYSFTLLEGCAYKSMPWYRCANLTEPGSGLKKVYRGRIFWDDNGVCHSLVEP